MGSRFERLPSFETPLSRHELLCVGELEVRVQYLLIAEVAKPGQACPDSGCDRIVPFAMPTQILFGLLLEVFDVRHRRSSIHLS
jgi:hypothetical protein